MPSSEEAAARHTYGGEQIHGQREDTAELSGFCEVDSDPDGSQPGDTRVREEGLNVPLSTFLAFFFCFLDDSQKSSSSSSLDFLSCS